MKSFTDSFVRHPVLALVVNLALVLVGWRTEGILPVQQYPSIDSASVIIRIAEPPAGSQSDAPPPPN